MAGAKDMKVALKAMTADGFEVQRDGGGHYLVIDPVSGERCHVASSPSSRGFRNSLARLKRLRRARANHSLGR